MKKLFISVLCCLFTAATFAGCYTGGPVRSQNSEITAEGDLKTGLGIVSGISNSMDAQDGQDGKGNVVFTAAAVLVDEAGKILSCDLDALEASVDFSAQGKITSDLSAPFYTKDEMGLDYNMKEVSSIQKEWDEQAEAFCNFVVGKTVSQLSEISLDESGKPLDQDLSAGCTITVSDFIKAVSLAVENATPRGADSGDIISLGISATPSDSKDAEDGMDGAVDISTTFVAASHNGNGTFTSAYIDCVDAAIAFNNAGEITTDLSVPLVSKYDLKEQYNMKTSSPIEKEWYEQADGFANFMADRTIDELTAAITDGYATDADLASSCTINTYAFLDAAVKAAAKGSK